MNRLLARLRVGQLDVSLLLGRFLFCVESIFCVKAM